MFMILWIVCNNIYNLNPAKMVKKNDDVQRFMVNNSIKNFIAHDQYVNCKLMLPNNQSITDKQVIVAS